MKPFKAIAYIQSLNLGKMNSTEMGEITIFRIVIFYDFIIYKVLNIYWDVF